MAVATLERERARPREFRPSVAGIAARTIVSLVIAGAVFLSPLTVGETWDNRISLMAIYAIIGLSFNILTGYAGQISLGHQAFVGIGAFTSSFVATRVGSAGFFVALPVAALSGALVAFGLGLIALRIRGLYLALVTLAFGLVAEGTIFLWRPYTGGGAGAFAPRPSAFQSAEAYAYLCLLALGFFLIVDWRFGRSKAGRAVVAVRNDERVASTLGVNVTAYKLLAFATSGFLAGAAGSLFAHWSGAASAEDYLLVPYALTWILMAVVGGLGSRAGVVIGSAFFALFPYLLPTNLVDLPILGPRSLAILSPLLGAFLLLLTITLYPGGIGQQLLPIRRWLAGGPFIERKRRGAAVASDAPAPAPPDGQPAERLAWDRAPDAPEDATATAEVPAVAPPSAGGGRGEGGP